jgi:hypothetical protein
MPAESKKCVVKDGKFVVPCAYLKRATEYGNPSPKRKGIYAVKLSIEGTPTRTFFAVKSGENVAKGAVLHFCPFCGERIEAPALRESTDRIASAPAPVLAA